MQVLVALAEADGHLVTSDELTARCWKGRVVGDNAIHRVISKLRHLASELGGDSFRIENVAKVGYRIVEERAQSGLESPAPSSVTKVLDRRLLLGAALALGVGVATPFAQDWYRGLRGPSATAQELYRRGMEAQRQALPEQNVQAAAFFRQAVEEEPEYSDAWGALAMAYRHLVESDPGRDQERLAALSRSAANRTLELDPDNADARLALLTIRPYFRNWFEMETALRRALSGHPNHWLYRGNIARILSETGRWEESIRDFEEVIERDEFLPFPRFRIALSYWSAGRLHQAEIALEIAARRWPAHPGLWFMRFDFLAYSGQTASALAMLDDAENRPIGVPEAVFEQNRVAARALAGRSPGDVDAAVDQVLQNARQNIQSISSGARLLSALGEVDLAFLLLGSYFFARPSSPMPAPPPISSLTRRSTDFLFMPMTASLRAHPRFDRLTQELGLDDYWAKTRSTPDYKRRL